MQLSALGLFSRLVWIDGAPLLDRIEPYRQRLFVRFFDERHGFHGHGIVGQDRVGEHNRLVPGGLRRLPRGLSQFAHGVGAPGKRHPKAGNQGDDNTLPRPPFRHPDHPGSIVCRAGDQSVNNFSGNP